jgi:CheY-like chemotaxis protein
VHGIIKNHGGIINVESKINTGTTFIIYFPILASMQDITISKENTLYKGNEKILLIDDEPKLAEVNKRILEDLGYRVESYSNSQEAIEKIRNNINSYDLILTDKTMPNISGFDIIREVKLLNPQMSVIIYSGYADDSDLKQCKELAIDEIMIKPINMHRLTQKIRKLLDK